MMSYPLPITPFSPESHSLSEIPNEDDGDDDDEMQEKDFGSPEKNSIYKQFRDVVSDLIWHYDISGIKNPWIEKQQEILEIVKENLWLLNEIAFEIDDSPSTILELSVYYRVVPFVEQLLRLGAKTNEKLIELARWILGNETRSHGADSQVVKDYVAILYMLEHGPDTLVL